MSYRRGPRTVHQTEPLPGPERLRYEPQRAQRRSTGKVCNRCGLQEIFIGPTKKLRACGKCMAVYRKVYYCSRKCQIEDWHNGTPTPHRRVCGVRLSPETREPPPPTTRLSVHRESIFRIPEPDPTFKRSASLRYQIMFLSQHPYVDYTFIFPDPLSNQGVFIRPLADRRSFLTLRDEALRSGELEAVQLMYYMLIGPAEGINYTRLSLKEQLEREYEVTLQDLPTGWRVPLNIEPNSPERISFVLPLSHNFDQEWPHLVAQRELGPEDSRAETSVSSDMFPGALLDLDDPENIQGPGSTADRVFAAAVFYTSFTGVSLYLFFLSMRYLLENPLLLIFVGPLLGSIFQVFSGVFWYGHRYIWEN
ncbi:hypothetical protein BDW22DRAFT_1488084 [Trametopsis cervina]|nr:hypothetical protein BDW22DRAFT_1488084 [Trametopsis cervina]